MSMMDYYIKKYKSDNYDIFLYVNTGRLLHSEELITKTHKLLRHTLRFMNYVRFRNAGIVIHCAVKWLHVIGKKVKLTSFY